MEEADTAPGRADGAGKEDRESEDACDEGRKFFLGVTQEIVIAWEREEGENHGEDFEHGREG